MITFLKVIQDTLSNTSSIGKSFFKESTDSVTLTTEISSLSLLLDDLWNYVFSKSTTNGALQVVDGFSRVSDSSSTQTQTTDPTTTWTDA